MRYRDVEIFLIEMWCSYYIEVCIWILKILSMRMLEGEVVNDVSYNVYIML